MNSSGKINYSLRRYPLLRTGVVVFVIALVFAAISIIKNKTKKVPEIESINPPVGSPGDVVLITGKNFGDVKDMSYVEIAGSKLTSSSYISWTDTSIKLVLPANIQDGLVVVGRKNMRSKPALFANEVDIPVPVTNVQQETKPFVTEINPSKAYVGQEIVIEGSNFGESRNQSKVVFTIDYDNKIKNSDIMSLALYTDNMIGGNEDEFDYISWSDKEIVVRVPDGACSGVLVVDTGKEKSVAKEINIKNDSGYKEFSNKKIYLIQYSADIADVVAKDFASITLRCPLPVVSCGQPKVEVTETSSTPILMNYQNNLIHQISKIRNNSPKKTFNQTFVLTVYEVNTHVNPDKIGNYKDVNQNLLEKTLVQDNLVPSENEEVVKLSREIVGQESNPYKKALLIYNYMTDNFKVSQNLRKNDANPVDLINLKKGDSYDFAVLYTALLRAAGIPSLTDSGILISSDLTSQAHWWCEFYIDRVGWIPVDPALGSGLEYKKWTDSETENYRDYYFGNLDSHHVTFSRGWKELKPFNAENKIVVQPKSFALQSIWEESDENTVKYSSYWGTPVVKGVY